MKDGLAVFLLSCCVGLDLCLRNRADYTENTKSFIGICHIFLYITRFTGINTVDTFISIVFKVCSKIEEDVNNRTLNIIKNQTLYY